MCMYFEGKRWLSHSTLCNTNIISSQPHPPDARECPRGTSSTFSRLGLDLASPFGDLGGSFTLCVFRFVLRVPEPTPEPLVPSLGLFPRLLRRLVVRLLDLVRRAGSGLHGSLVLVNSSGARLVGGLPCFSTCMRKFILRRQLGYEGVKALERGGVHVRGARRTLVSSYLASPSRAAS